MKFSIYSVIFLLIINFTACLIGDSGSKNEDSTGAGAFENVITHTCASDDGVTLPATGVKAYLTYLLSDIPYQINNGTEYKQAKILKSGSAVGYQEGVGFVVNCTQMKYEDKTTGNRTFTQFEIYY